MLTRMMKCFSVAALLLLPMLLWRSSASYPTAVAAFVVCAGAMVVLVQAARAGKYFWMVVFLAVAGLSNPILPVLLSRHWFFALDVVILILFLVSLVVLKTQPRLSVASITDRTPGSESL